MTRLRRTEAGEGQRAPGADRQIPLCKVAFSTWFTEIHHRIPWNFMDFPFIHVMLSRHLLLYHTRRILLLPSVKCDPLNRWSALKPWRWGRERECKSILVKPISRTTVCKRNETVPNTRSYGHGILASPCQCHRFHMTFRRGTWYIVTQYKRRNLTC
jgi:hypothetical protein